MKGIVLGCGNMSQAMIQGMKGVVDFKQTFFYTPSKTRAKNLAQEVGGLFAQELDDLPRDPDFVFINCKPQQFNQLAQDLKGRFTSNPLFISILAATPRSLHETLLGSDRILRVMPNMPVRYQKGVSLLLSSNGVSDSEKKKWTEYLGSLGMIKWTQTEEEFNRLMLLCGSGPAFMYQWLRWLSQMSDDLDLAQREELSIAVMEGALFALKSAPEKNLETLIGEVTSKGGVTAAVLEGWKTAGVEESLKKGFIQGEKRTNEIQDLIIKGP
ncbi:MAG: pyrroline-5-carboxylate reductase family protein [Bacteriovoracaceae bacterium]